MFNYTKHEANVLPNSAIIGVSPVVYKDARATLATMYVMYVFDSMLEEKEGNHLKYLGFIHWRPDSSFFSTKRLIKDAQMLNI